MRVALLLAWASLAHGLNPQHPPCSASVSSRRTVLSAAAATTGAAALAGLTALPASASSFFDPPDRTGLQSKWLEKVRILIQDEADAVQYGGELAPGGPPPGPPFLQLIPILQLQQAMVNLKPQLQTYDTQRWKSVATTLSSGSFEPREFKRIFNAYSDNIYYDSSSAQANAYLLGGATPTSAQTTQYLLRNEVLKQLDECRDEIIYQQGVKPEERDVEVAVEALQKALKYLDEYLSLAPPEQYKTALKAIRGED